jgi:hypothetical protein
MPPPYQPLTATAADWASANSVLPAGAIAFEEDTERVKIGDGVTPWAALPYLAGGGGGGGGGGLQPANNLSDLPSPPTARVHLGVAAVRRLPAAALSPTDGTANRTAVQAALAAAVAAGEALELPAGTWPLTVTHDGDAVYYCLKPPTTADYCTLLVPPGCTVRMANGQLTDGKHTNVFLVRNHPGGGFVGWPHGLGGTLDGNEAGQPGFTAPQSAVAQSSVLHDGIKNWSTVAGATKNWTVQGLRIVNFKCHPVNWSVENALSTTYGANGRFALKDVVCERFGEGPVVSCVDGLWVENLTLVGEDAFTYGDFLEPALCRGGGGTGIVVHGGGTTVATSSSVLDLYGSKRLTFTNVVGSRVGNGFSFKAPTDAGLQTEDCLVSGFVLDRIVAGYFEGPLVSGACKVANGLCVGGAGFSTAALVGLSSGNGAASVFELENVRTTGCNGIQVGDGARGTLVLTAVSMEAGDPAAAAIYWDTRSTPHANSAVIRAAGCRATGYAFGLLVPTGAAVPAGSRLDFDFAGCAVPKRCNVAGASLANVEFVRPVLGGDALAPQAADVTSPDLFPLQGYAAVPLGAGGGAVTALTAGHKDQTVRVRFTTARELQHGAGNLRLSGAANATFAAGDELELRWDGANWTEVGRGGPGVPLAGTAVTVYATATGAVPHTVRMAPGQTADPAQVQLSDGTVLAGTNAHGGLFGNSNQSASRFLVGTLAADRSYLQLWVGDGLVTPGFANSVLLIKCQGATQEVALNAPTADGKFFFKVNNGVFGAILDAGRWVFLPAGVSVFSGPGDTAATASVLPRSAGEKGLVVRRLAGQTQDVFEVQSDAASGTGGARLMGITPAGRLRFDAADPAPADTTTPDAWLTVFLGGTAYRVPLYTP